MSWEEETDEIFFHRSNFQEATSNSPQKIKLSWEEKSELSWALD